MTEIVSPAPQTSTGRWVVPMLLLLAAVCVMIGMRYTDKPAGATLIAVPAAPFHVINTNVTYRYTLPEISRGFALDPDDPSMSLSRLINARITAHQATFIPSRASAWVAFNDLLLNASSEENDALVNIIHPGERQIGLELMVMEGTNAAAVLSIVPSGKQVVALDRAGGDAIDAKLKLLDYESTGLSSRTRIDLLDQHSASVAVTTDQAAYVEQLTPIYGWNAWGFDPTVGVFQSGMVFNCSVRASDDLTTAEILIKARLIRLNALETVTASIVCNDTFAFVQVPRATARDELRPLRLARGGGAVIRLFEENPLGGPPLYLVVRRKQ
jgi:hypothetical protein